MKLNELLFEVELEKLCHLILEKVGVNNTIESWDASFEKLGIGKEDLQQKWDESKEIVQKQYGKLIYPIVMSIFKKKVAALKGFHKQDVESLGTAKFDHKIRTRQTPEQFKSGEPAPKSAKPGEVKKVKEKMAKINAQMREIKAGPANTPLRKQRIKQQLEELKAKKKELQDSIK